MTARAGVMVVLAFSAGLVVGCGGSYPPQQPAQSAAAPAAAAPSGVPAGTIVAFYGLEIPPGWVLCDGRTTAAGKMTPDLRHRFIMGLDPATGALGEQGGSETHTHTARVGQPTEKTKVDNGDSEKVADDDHTHTVTVAASSNLPPYVKLVYIMKE